MTDSHVKRTVSSPQVCRDCQGEGDGVARGELGGGPQTGDKCCGEVNPHTCMGMAGRQRRTSGDFF